MNVNIQEMSDADAIGLASKTGSNWLLYLLPVTFELKAVNNAGVVYRFDTSGATGRFITP